MHSVNFLIITAVALAEPGFSADLKVLRGHHPVVANVTLNGSGPYRFLVDTGAQMNQFDARIARSLGIAPSFQGIIETAGGKIPVAGSSGIEVRLGDAAASGQEFLFTNLDAVRTISADIQGVLGQEFLSRFDYLLDLRGRRLVFGTKEVDGSRHALEFVDGLPVIATSLGNLLLDSGANRLVLFSSGSIASGAIADGTSVVTASGSASAEVSAPRQLRIGARGYGRVETVVVRAPERRGMDGLLPLSTFQSVYVSSSGKYAVLK